MTSTQRVHEWKRKYPDRYREHVRRRNITRYGISVEEYERMASEHAGKCGICLEPCKSKARLGIDHDHRTGVVRGLLCDACNRGLGYFHDNPKKLRAAAQYLETGPLCKGIPQEHQKISETFYS